MKKMSVSGKKVLLLTPKKPPLGTSPLHYGDFRSPLGLGFLAAYLEKYGHEVKIIGNHVQEQNIVVNLGALYENVDTCGK